VVAECPIGDRIVAEARTWIGVPFRHQGRTRAGVDCAGHSELSLRAAGGVLPTMPIPNYPRHPDPIETRAALAASGLVEVPFSERAAGDLILFSIAGETIHMGIYTGRATNTVIHAYSTARRCVEHRLDAAWERRARLVYRYLP